MATEHHHHHHHHQEQQQQQQQEFSDPASQLHLQHHCTECDRSFGSLSSLKQHRSSIHFKGQGTICCHICNRKYTQVSNLSRHLRLDHHLTGNTGRRRQRHPVPVSSADAVPSSSGAATAKPSTPKDMPSVVDSVAMPFPPSFGSQGFLESPSTPHTISWPPMPDGPSQAQYLHNPFMPPPPNPFSMVKYLGLVNYMAAIAHMRRLNAPTMTSSDSDVVIDDRLPIPGRRHLDSKQTPKRQQLLVEPKPRCFGSKAVCRLDFGVDEVTRSGLSKVAEPDDVTNVEGPIDLRTVRRVDDVIAYNDDVAKHVTPVSALVQPAVYPDVPGCRSSAVRHHPTNSTSPRLSGTSAAVTPHRQQGGAKPARRTPTTGSICPVCNAMLAGTANLRRHMRVHTGEKPFSCVHCNQTFSISSNRTRHVRNVHRNQSTAGTTIERDGNQHSQLSASPTSSPELKIDIRESSDEGRGSE